MPKFTPGPWEKVTWEYQSRNDRNFITVIQTKEDAIAEIWTLYRTSGEEKEANARLIAKAPEMYKMLKRFDEALSGFDKHVREGFTSLFYDYSVLKSEIDGE